MFSVQLAERAFVESDDSADVALEPGMKKMATSPSGTNTAMTEWNRRMPMYSRPTSRPSMAVRTMLVTSPATSSGVASRNRRLRQAGQIGQCDRHADDDHHHQEEAERERQGEGADRTEEAAVEAQHRVVGVAELVEPLVADELLGDAVGRRQHAQIP